MIFQDVLDFTAFYFDMSVDCCKFVVKYNISYTMTYTIEKVTTLIGARRFGASDAKIGFVLTDSRSLCFPEETLFFALKSGRNDGHYYIPELYRRGVRNFVVTARRTRDKHIITEQLIKPLFDHCFTVTSRDSNNRNIEFITMTLG